MPLLLRRHSGDQLGFRAVAAKDGELPGIDPGCAIFAGLVDAQHRGAVRAAVAGAPAGHARRAFHDKARITAAPPSEMIAFHPAMEMPRNDHWTWSQRTIGAWTIARRRSAVLEPLALV